MKQVNNWDPIFLNSIADEFVTDVEIEKKIGLTHSDLEGNCLIILQDKDTNNGKRRSVISNNKNNWTKKLACIAERYIKRNNNEISDKKLFNSNCKPPPGAKGKQRYNSKKYKLIKTSIIIF